MSRVLLIAALVAGLVAPADAAGDIFAGASRPGANDAGPCAQPESPCATIQAAVDKAEAAGGGTVRVLANPDGRTTDAYAETVVLDGSAPVTLIGAGRRANGTLVAHSAGTPLTLAAGTTAHSLRLAAPAGGTAIAGADGSTVDDAVADAPDGTAYSGAGRVEDSRLVGATGALLDGARLVRTEVVSTLDGVVARLDTSELLQVVVRARLTLDAPPTGDALRVGGDAAAARAELRHVTLTGFPTRLRLDGRVASATLQAANATLGGPGGTDLQLQGQHAGARLRTVNRAPARTLFTDGAATGALRDTDPVDLEPALTPDGNLSPGSPLVDRGTPAGLFSGDPDNKTDIGGAPRRQGAAPDIGADELAPAGPDGLRWVTVGTFRDPMYVAAPPGDIDRIFVVERRGTVIAVDDGQILPTAALNISAKISGNAGGGLQSIAFGPDFAVSHHVYGFYSRKDDPATPEVESRGDIVIAEWTMDAANPNRIDVTSERQVMLIPHPNSSHFGGTLAFGPDGYLYISTGDGDRQPIPSQELSRPLGKVLRIDPRAAGGMPYTVPPDNPYLIDGDPQTLPEIWARGLRNPFRMGFDSVTGDLWIGDVGQNRFEELNLLRGADGRDPRANFGWKITEGDVMVGSDQAVTPGNEPPDYVAPVVVHRHDEDFRSVTAGTVVHDPTIPALDGQFLYADFFHGVTRAAIAAPGGVSTDAEVEGLVAIPGVTSYTLDACNRVYATQLVQVSATSGTVRRLTTTGQCVPPTEACTVEGTAAAEVLTGTGSDDVICGLGGNDRLVGLGGNDLLSGGAGDDTLVGGPGADPLQGGDGSDLADYGASIQPVAVTIGTGADDGVSGEGDDVQVDVERVQGGAAADLLTAGVQHASLIGGAGADVLRGSPAKDKLNGKAGDDELEGGDGPDELLGGGGGDELHALDGVRDRLVCGTGVDTHESDSVDVVDASCEVAPVRAGR